MALVAAYRRELLLMQNAAKFIKIMNLGCLLRDDFSVERFDKLVELEEQYRPVLKALLQEEEAIRESISPKRRE